VCSPVHLVQLRADLGRWQRVVAQSRPLALPS
jgi:hypothetical protein